MLSSGVVTGTGCVYPAEVQNIGTQLSAKRKSLEGLPGGHGQRPQPRGRRLRAPGAEHAGRNPESGGRGRLRNAARPVRVLPLGDRRTEILRQARGRAGLADAARCRAAALRGETGLATDLTKLRQDAEVLLHHAQPLQRRARLPLHQPAERRLGAGRHRRLPGNVGAEDHGLAGLPRKRPDRDHLRRGRGLRSGSLLRRGTGARLAAARHHRPRRRPRRRGAALARSSNRAPSAPSPTTTTPRSPAGRRCWAFPGSPTRRPCPARSDQTCSRGAARAAGHRAAAARLRPQRSPAPGRESNGSKATAGRRRT